MPKNEKLNNHLLQILLYLSIVTILLLSALNVTNYVNDQKVLGVSTNGVPTDIATNTEFWTDFLSKNPNYIPGWIEIERFDKAVEIDPNFGLF